MSIVLSVAAVVAALSLLWLAGEQHRANCIASHAQPTGCNVLPWSEGNR